MTSDGSEHPDATDGGSAPSLTASAVRGARLALVGWGTSQGLNFAAYLVLARLVDPTDFGHFAAASVVTGVGGLFAESGMMSALISRRDRIRQAASTAFFSLLLSGLLLTVLAAAVSPLLGAFFRSARVGELSAALSGWLFLRAMTVVPDSLLQRRLSFARRVAVDPLGAIAFAGVSIVLCGAGARAWGLVAGTYASMLVQVVAAWLFVRERPRWSLASMAMWRELSGFARPVLGSEILRRVASQLDALMLGRFSGAAPLGQYRNGLRLAQQPTNAFVDVGAYVLLPILARLQDERERLGAATRRVLRLALAGAVPVSVAMIPLGVPVAVLFLGQRWRPAGHAIAGLAGMLLGGSLNSIASEILKVVGRPGKLVRLHGLSLILSAVLITGGAALFGLVGVAVAVSLTQLAVGLYAYGLAAPWAGLRWRELAEMLWRPALASLVLLGVMQGFSSLTHPLLRGEAAALALILAETTAGAVAYAIVLAALDRRMRADAGRLLARRRARRLSHC